MTNSQQLINQAVQTLQIEADAIQALIPTVGDDFVKACELIQRVSGRVVVLGMGKSGHIGNKIAATLASTGTPAFFVHPAEASHGDLGMITKHDVVLALSNSGETEEIVRILPVIKRLGVPLIAMTGNAHSTLANQANIHLTVKVNKEACPLNLAPTASSTASLALGDALAVALLDAKGFAAEDFARSHPGGKLGKKLLTYVEDIMHTGDAIPTCQAKDSLLDGIMEISKKGMGFVIITDVNNKVVGVFTDGDLRRVIPQHGELTKVTLSEVMIYSPKVSNQEMLADEALKLMEKYKISALPVVNNNNQLLGAINTHDLLRAGII